MVYAILKRIDISPAFVGFLCAYYFFNPMESFAPFLISVALHEAGHIAMLLIMRCPIHSIKLRMSGAQIMTAPLSYFQELIVACAGPFVNALLLCIYRQSNPFMAFLNFCLLLYNLMPIYPLDGGRIVNSLLQILLPQRVADTIVHVIAASCLCLIIVLSCYLTCYWHAGLWPILVSAGLLLRLGEMFLKEKENFAHL